MKAEAVIFTFSHLIEQYATENHACEKVGELRMGHGLSPSTASTATAKHTIRDTQHDPVHFDIALALAEYATDL